METLAETSIEAASKLAAWKAARRDYAATQRRMWQTAIVLGPLAFAGLALLTRVQCPVPIDFLSLGGASSAVMLLWLYVGERCQMERDRAGEELRAAEVAIGQRPVVIEGGAADRMVRVILAVLFVFLWGWTWAVRPDCSAVPEEESELTTFIAER